MIIALPLLIAKIDDLSLNANPLFLLVAQAKGTLCAMPINLSIRRCVDKDEKIFNELIGKTRSKDPSFSSHVSLILDVKK